MFKTILSTLSITFSILIVCSASPTEFTETDTSGVQIDSITVGANCIILTEEDRIAFSGTKAEFIQIVFSKKVKVKILNSEGVDYYAHLQIPVLHDKHVPKQAPKINNLMPYLQSQKIKHFKYWVNGKERYPPETSYEEVERAIDETFIYTDVFTYLLDSINVGDILEYEYRVEAPYRTNWQRFLGYRVFFHGTHPKKKYTFYLNFPKKLLTEIYDLNDAKFTQTEQNGYVEIKVEKTDLLGCTDEVGARLHLDLPHLTFAPKPYQWHYIPFDSNFGKFLPFHIAMARSRESQALNIIRKFDFGVNEPDLNTAREFIQKYEKTTSKYSTFKDAHDQIVTQFEFLDDREYLAAYDTRKRRIGAHMSSSKLRNINRFDTYRYLFAGLKLPYNSVYPCDARYGQLGPHYTAPMKTNDYLFVVDLDSTAAVVYPKKSVSGYYLNELPFYFENSTAIRIAIDDIFPPRFTNFNHKMDMVKLPLSPPSKNTRKINTQIKIEGSKTESFTSHISLSGQFSTNGRHIYRNEDCDPSINPTYCQTLQNIPSVVSTPTSTIKKEDTTPPFRFMCELKFEADIAETKEGSMTLNLSGMFPHIIEQKELKLPRHLPYYSDFLGTDIVRYMVELDENYELLENPAFEISNEYGNFVFMAELTTPNTLTISSAHVVKKMKVAPLKIQEVMEIQNAIRTLNNSQIVLKKL